MFKWSILRIGQDHVNVSIHVVISDQSYSRSHISVPDNCSI